MKSLAGDFYHMAGQRNAAKSNATRRNSEKKTNLLFGVGPARDLDNHVQNSLLLVRIERDVVEAGNRLAIPLDVHAVFEGVGLANLANGVGHGGGCRTSGRR